MEHFLVWFITLVPIDFLILFICHLSSFLLVCKFCTCHLFSILYYREKCIGNLKLRCVLHKILYVFLASGYKPIKKPKWQIGLVNFKQTIMAVAYGITPMFTLSFTYLILKGYKITHLSFP
ncbi:MAG: hypothetical protein KatS3mg035_0981 [Bacteroidia bacterium]|nr:MAG: hypothetical protein KatS3mg035_0981 [Bacteroidia bacterium]